MRITAFKGGLRFLWVIWVRMDWIRGKSFGIWFYFLSEGEKPRLRDRGGKSFFFFFVGGICWVWVPIDWDFKASVGLIGVLGV